MAVCYISIGSNIGNRIENCEKVIREIENFAVLKSVSSIYETEPVGNIDQPYFINCVAEFVTYLTPNGLLVNLQEIENKFGRKRDEIGGPRIIDLDIIFYEDRVIKNDNLTIPHPSAHLRRFVLEPLNEIARELIHPVLKSSVSELLSDLSDEKSVKKIGKFSTSISQ